MFDGRLQIYRRSESGPWHAAARVGKKRFRKGLKETGLEQARDLAEEWYLGLRGKLRNGEIVPDERTFGQVADAYLDEAKVLAQATRSKSYVENLKIRMYAHILPYFGNKPFRRSIAVWSKAIASNAPSSISSGPPKKTRKATS